MRVSGFKNPSDWNRRSVTPSKYIVTRRGSYTIICQQTQHFAETLYQILEADSNSLNIELHFAQRSEKDTMMKIASKQS